MSSARRFTFTPLDLQSDFFEEDAPGFHGGELSGKWRVGQRVWGRASLALEDFVKRRQNEEREQRGTGEAADDDGGERLLDCGAGIVKDGAAPVALRAALTSGCSRRNLRDMRSRFLPLLLVLSVLPLAQVLYPGCATVTGGVTQRVRVKSKPAGARVLLNGKQVGVTPVTAVVSRWGWHKVRIELDGYEPYEVRLEKKFNDTVLWNAWIGGAWIVVDAVSGAIFELDVSPEAKRGLLKNHLDKDDWVGSPALFSPGTLVITVGLHPVGPTRKIGQMTKR